MTLAEGVERLLRLHDSVGSPIRRQLRPPVDEATVRGLLAELELEPPAELVALYGLYDGTDDPWFFLVGDGVRFARSAAAAEACRELRSSAAEVAAAPWWDLSPSDLWRPEWFPVFPLTRSDENVAIDCRPGSADFGRLTVVLWEATAQRLVAESLSEFFAALAERFDALGTRWDEEIGVLVDDDELRDRLGLFP